MQFSIFSGKNEFKIDKPIRLIELFAGIGSQAKALKNIGADFEHYKIVEFDKYAVKSYNAIHGTNFETSDITKITTADLQITDIEKYCYIMTYSFPCQDLSKAGKQNGMDRGSGTRSGLLWEVERLLDRCEKLPQVLLMENVPDVKGKINIRNFAEWIAKLESLGYKNYWQCLNAKDYGVAQNRDRCFMVSIQGDYFYEFPQSIKLENNLNKLGYIKAEDIGFVGSREARIYNNYISTLRATRKPEIMLYSENENHLITANEALRFMGFTDEDFNKIKSIGMSNNQIYKQAGNSIVVDVLEHIFRGML